MQSQFIFVCNVSRSGKKSPQDTENQSRDRKIEKIAGKMYPEAGKRVPRIQKISRRTRKIEKIAGKMYPEAEKTR